LQTEVPRCTDIKTVQTSTKRSLGFAVSIIIRRSSEIKGMMEGKFQLTVKEVDQSMEYLASLICHRLDTAKTASDALDVNPSEDGNSSNPPNAYQLAKGRFNDLTTTLHGEHILENLFLP
jgi:hypothetical protein